MRNAWRCTMPLGLLVGLLACSEAQATVLQELNLEQLTRRATVVVRGKVERVQVVRAGGHYWTDSHVRVLERIKGKYGLGQLVQLRQPGGQLGRYGERVVGVARFKPGEEVLVFARPLNGRLAPVGMALGKFRLQREADGRTWARRQLGGVALARFNPKGRMRLRHPGIDARPLAELRQAVARELRRSKEGNR